jgi:ABC-type Fe3+/spermidine/putrescine transport system ATPase subunit
MASLSVNALVKTFGQKTALKGVSFEVDLEETLAILGPSGCGKSTLLNIIAGLEQPDSGIVLWEGKSLMNIPPYRRGFGLMFQDYALFPHRNVFENVAFGLRMQKYSPQAIQTRVSEMLELVHLTGFEKRDVNTLSGGEAQRVALARALAPQPHLLMLDEPLGALDRDLRERLAAELRLILKKIDQTAIYVTHDQEEAFTLADRVIIMNMGQIEQTGTAQDIYQRPKSLFVARFLGLTNLLPGTAHPTEQGSFIQSSIGKFSYSSVHSGEVTVLIRPEFARLDDSGVFQLNGILREVTFRGTVCRISLEINQTLLSFDFLPNTQLPNVGSPIRLSLNPEEAIQVMDNTGRSERASNA